MSTRRRYLVRSPHNGLVLSMLMVWGDTDEEALRAIKTMICEAMPIVRVQTGRSQVLLEIEEAYDGGP